MRGGSAEDGHDGVPDELLHRPRVALDLLAQTGVVGADAGAHVLRVSRLGGGSEADEIAEEDGDDLALLLQGERGPFGQRRRAEAAEREAVRILLAAGRTRGHSASLGRRFESVTPRLRGHRAADRRPRGVLKLESQ